VRPEMERGAVLLWPDEDTSLVRRPEDGPLPGGGLLWAAQDSNLEPWD
jgi:hypothetical protein